MPITAQALLILTTFGPCLRRRYYDYYSPTEEKTKARSRLSKVSQLTRANTRIWTWSKSTSLIITLYNLLIVYADQRILQRFLNPVGSFLVWDELVVPSDRRPGPRVWGIPHLQMSCLLTFVNLEYFLPQTFLSSHYILHLAQPMRPSWLQNKRLR